jgi:two-component system chemotaxis response regulator CheY
MSHQDQPERRLDSPSSALDGAQLLLIVEAQERPRNPYHSVLQQAGYDVMVVPYEEAGAASRKTGPALIILHLAEPAVSGLGLVRELRTQADTRGTPVIALMRFDDAHTREQVVRAGATAILIEPVKPPMLLRQLRRLLARVLAGAHASAAGASKMILTPTP